MKYSGRGMRKARGVKGACVSKKMRYATRKAADAALDRLRKANNPAHTETRVYSCDRCAGFHLTSKSECC